MTFNPSTQYASGMINYAYDFTGDGWPDILMTDSRPIALYVNPGNESRRWNKYMVVPGITTEEVLFRYVDGDGKPEVVFGDNNAMSYAKPDPADPPQPWIVHTISDKITVNVHAIGVGDINGDRRMDILSASGWWEQPAKDSKQELWIISGCGVSAEIVAPRASPSRHSEQSPYVVSRSNTENYLI